MGVVKFISVAQLRIPKSWIRPRYICLWTPKKFESYFSDRLTFSNICGKTSHRIYRLALALLSLEMLSSLSKLRNSYLMHTLLYLSEG